MFDNLGQPPAQCEPRGLGLARRRIDEPRSGGERLQGAFPSSAYSDDRDHTSAGSGQAFRRTNTERMFGRSRTAGQRRPRGNDESRSLAPQPAPPGPRKRSASWSRQSCDRVPETLSCDPHSATKRFCRVAKVALPKLERTGPHASRVIVERWCVRVEGRPVNADIHERARLVACPARPWWWCGRTPPPSSTRCMSVSSMSISTF